MTLTGLSFDTFVIHNRYPDFEVLGDEGRAQTGGVASRYTKSGLLNLLIDIHTLSLCNYLVCTFSSQVYSPPLLPTLVLFKQLIQFAFYIQSTHEVYSCTLQVCRVAYELMQTYPHNGDPSEWYRSLDDFYYFGGQNGHNFVATADDPGGVEGVIDVQAGDTLGLAGNHWDGILSLPLLTLCAPACTPITYFTDYL